MSKYDNVTEILNVKKNVNLHIAQLKNGQINLTLNLHAWKIISKRPFSRTNR